MGNTISVFCMTWLVAWSAVGADWPQWRGVQRDGHSPESVASWSQPPKAAWSIDVGEAHSSPIVAAGVLFYMEKEKGTTTESVVAVEAATGKIRWRRSYHAPFANVYGNGPRATPLVSKGRVIALGARGDLNCLDADTGAAHWSLNLLERFKASNLFFGTSGSPMVADDMVLVMAGGPKAGVVALSIQDGSTRWTSQDDRASYASPTLMGQGDARQAVFLTREGLLSLRPKDGSLVGRWPLLTFNDENAVTPLPIGDRVLGSSVSYGSVAVRLDEKPPTAAWQSKELVSYFASPVLFENDVYIVSGTPALLKCVDAQTGRVRWSQGPVGLMHASLIVAKDKILMLGDTGLLTLLEPSKEKYSPRAKAKLCGPTWVHPALSDGWLYVRDAKSLQAFELPGETPSGSARKN